MLTSNARRQHSISLATLYRWKAKLSGVNLLDPEQLRALVDETAKLKKQLAQHSMYNATSKIVASRKW